METQHNRAAARLYQLPMAGEIAHHRHVQPYATLILEGAYEEAGDSGRWPVEAGDVLIHGAFSAHRDRLAQQRTQVLDLILPLSADCWAPCGRVKNPDAVVRAAERGQAGAARLLMTMMEEAESGEADAPDLLALELTSGAAPALADWAARLGLARETVSRQFSWLYGLPPARYRAEARARAAWRRIIGGGEALAEIATDAGFADQPHMNRGVKALTGLTPGQWRRWRSDTSQSFKT